MLTDAEREFCFNRMGMSGSFMEKLISTIQAADIINQSKLSMGFPEMVSVVRRFQQEEGYWDDLVSAIVDELTNGRHDVIDLDSAEFDLTGKEISLESADLDENKLEEAIISGVNDYINRR